MPAKSKKLVTRAPRLYERVRGILESARASAARSVNTAQVLANCLIGREIVEEEQKGKGRADYGKELVASLSARITQDFGPGYSVSSLYFIKQFYLSYPELVNAGQILHAPRGERREMRQLAPPEPKPAKKRARKS